jgi:hypothetical protein
MKVCAEDQTSLITDAHRIGHVDINRERCETLVMRRAALLGMAAIVALLAEGCGSGSKPLTKDEFIAKAARTCRSANAAAANLPTAKNAEEADHVMPKALVIEKRTDSQLHQLEPPAAMRSKWTRYLELRKQLVARVAKALSQYRAGHLASFISSLKALDDIDGRSGDIVYALGIHACAPN